MASNYFKYVMKTKLHNTYQSMVEKDLLSYSLYIYQFWHHLGMAIWGWSYRYVYRLHFVIEQMGCWWLIVNPQYPFLGESYDAWMTCLCHSGSLVLVKCPYCCRDYTMVYTQKLVSNFKNFPKTDDILYRRAIHTTIKYSANWTYVSLLFCCVVFWWDGVHLSVKEFLSQTFAGYG